MFIGHLAVGLASKKLAPRASLGILMAAPLLLDLLWPLFLLAGWESVRIAPGDTAFTPLDFVSYPISHSLLAAAVWGALFALLYFWIAGGRAAAWVIFAGVVSHWVMDFITHRPDLPLWPGGPQAGLGLWNSVPATVILELLLFGAAVWLYARVTRPVSRAGTYGFASFVILTLLIDAGNIMGPPPPDERSLAWFALALWIFPFWCAWFDRRRAPLV